MSTSNFSIAPTNTSDATFRAWGLALHNAIAAVLTYVAQTGEIDFTTVLTPSAITQNRGFKIYRFNDAQQATHPVYIKIGFGSGSGTAASPGIFVSIGAGVDGSGNLTYPNTSNYASLPATSTVPQPLQMNTNSASAYDCYVSGDGSRLSIMLWPLFVTVNPIVFNVERSRATSGAYTDEAVVYFSTAPVHSPQNALFAAPKDWHCIRNNKTNSGNDFKVCYPEDRTQATYGSRMSVFPPEIWLQSKVLNSVTGVVMYLTADYDGNDFMTVNCYGGTAAYFPSQRATTGNVNSGSNWKFAIRND